ncbi:phage integrase [Pseudomonas sp. Q1-7]|uniref:phage integrase n=1 Tax=Pseudomonas sp. Q1-7 TaxID=3020843 RepID=UPI002300D526|nr:hypothetical protein [Pseudomonas sp. Q1-7]
MTVRKDGECWMADFYENGQAGRHICKHGFATREAAERYESDFLALRQLTGRPLDERLSDLVRLWHERRGHFVRNSGNRLNILLGTVKRLGDPVISEFDATVWSRYEQTRSTQTVPKRVRAELRYLSAVYSDLIRYGVWRGENPFAPLREAESDVAKSSVYKFRRSRELFAEVDDVDLELPPRTCKARAAQFND